MEKDTPAIHTQTQNTCKAEKYVEIPNFTTEVSTQRTKATQTKPSKDLTPKEAIEFLLDGTLKYKVCRYCLKIEPHLSLLDQIIHVAGVKAIYKVSIRDIVAGFHPFKVQNDPNLPDRICQRCLDRAISAYLFTQQCERAERALHNFLDDMYDRLEKLDPLERTQKRGRQKQNPNYNVLHAAHDTVIDYAESVIHIVNTASQVLTNQSPISDLECLKCSEIFPNIESLINHTTTHPKSMWYNCRLCGTSFPKRCHLKKHLNAKHGQEPLQKPIESPRYDCSTCSFTFDKYYDYLQHLEKHKFKTVLNHLIAKKMYKLCFLCYAKGRNMVGIGEKIHIHGGSLELTGEKPLASIVAAILPQMNILESLGTKICETCLNNVLTSYVFINHSYFTRNRLSTCVSNMIDKLDVNVDVSKNICIEISDSAIMQVNEEFDETEEQHKSNDEKMKVDILEDEYRTNCDDESEADNPHTAKNTSNDKLPQILEKVMQKKDHIIDDEHKTETRNGFRYANEICSEFLTFKKDSSRHLVKFVCPICSKHFVSDYFLKRHIIKHMPKQSECHVCKDKFSTKFGMYEHIKMAHIFSKSIYLACKICGRCFIEKKKLKKHEIYHKKPLCQICDKMFLSQSMYYRHLQRHLKRLGITIKKQQHSCSFCERECSNDNELSLHVNKCHLQIKPYSCDMCEHSFYTEYNLRFHKKVHNMYQKEQCEFCDKTLYSRRKLVIHIRKHIGDMPHACQLCSKSFYSEYSLKRHMISNHGGGALCKICRTVFRNKHELKVHMQRVHYSIF